MKHDNWINEDIVIDFPLPRILQSLIEELEQFNREENYAYFNYSEALDDAAKEMYVQGKLTKEQWDLLCAKYCAF